jgi:hypothetical protein
MTATGYLPHRLVHRRVRGQPGAEVEKLADALGGGAGRRGADELPIVPDQLRQRGVQLGHPPAHIPVGSEIVLSAQPVVVDTGDARPGHIDARGGILVHHDPRLLSLARHVVRKDRITTQDHFRNKRPPMPVSLVCVPSRATEMSAGLDRVPGLSDSADPVPYRGSEEIARRK